MNFAEKSKETSAEEKSDICSKDFYWDHLVLYLASAIFGLTFLDILTVFFGESVVRCFTPSDVNLTRDGILYLNNYCYGSLPNSRYFLTFIFLSASIVYAPHYLWKSYFEPQFDCFFNLVKQLDRLRNLRTGEYRPLNYKIVERLESQFCKRNGILRWYVTKLICQLLISVTVFFLNVLYFRDFDETFRCPKIIPLSRSEWPLREPVTCVYNSLHRLSFLKWAACILVGVAVIIIIVGILWCFVGHSNELGAHTVAKFCNASYLTPSEFPHGLSFQYLFRPRICNDLDFLLMRLYSADSGLGQAFRDIQINKRINMEKEQDHQLLNLLKQMHIDRNSEQLRIMLQPEKGNVQDLYYKSSYSAISTSDGVSSVDTNQKHFEQLLYSYCQSEMGLDDLKWSYSPLRSTLCSFLHLANNNGVVIDISFQTATGLSLVLARAFRKTVAVHFIEHYQNDDKETVCQVDKYENNYKTVKIPANIFSHVADHIKQCIRLITEDVPEKHSIDLIVIGPIKEQSNVATVNLLIQKLHASNSYRINFTKIISVRPLMIGSKSTVNSFERYTPPQSTCPRALTVCTDVELEVVVSRLRSINFRLCRLFEDISKSKVQAELEMANIPFHFVNEDGKVGVVRNQHAGASQQAAELPYGIEMLCDSVKCILEFSVYERKFKTD